jgi:hypothetical protein
MIVNNKFVQFHQILKFFIFVNITLKFLSRISASSEFCKLWPRNLKSMVKDKKSIPQLPTLHNIGLRAVIVT